MRGDKLERIVAVMAALGTESRDAHDFIFGTKHVKKTIQAEVLSVEDVVDEPIKEITHASNETVTE